MNMIHEPLTTFACSYHFPDIHLEFNPICPLNNICQLAKHY